jgi:uncharacterized protein
VAPQLSQVDVTGTGPTLTPTVPAMSWRVVTVLALVVGVAACRGDDATSTATAPATSGVPTTTGEPGPTAGASSGSPTTVGPPGVAPTGFDTVAGRVTAADGSTCDVCLWVARTSEEHQRGLMGVTDLSGADGMLFRFGAPTSVNFWMRDTPLPLSIAFFAADGTFVSSADMTPCMTGPDAACARYAADGEYADALEVAAGRLPGLLIAPGSHLAVTDTPCPLSP